MCGRYVAPDERAMEDYFHIGRHNWQSWAARYNVAPTSAVPIVYRPQAEVLGELARWGLIPSWWKKDSLPTMTFNARSEEAASKPTWRQAIRSARCLMPARGWYEWNEHEPVVTEAGRKGYQPWYFHSPGADVMAIAGLWSQWQSPAGTTVLSCALLTRDAAANLAHVHHRMPVILEPSCFGAWLAQDTTTEEVSGMIVNSRADFVAHRVSTRVNNVRNDANSLLDEWTYETR